MTLSEAEGFHISPSNRRAAIVAHGEIFTVATERGEPQRVSESPWRDQDVRWSPNGKWIAFVSDRTGRQEVWISDELGSHLHCSAQVHMSWEQAPRPDNFVALLSAA